MDLINTFTKWSYENTPPGLQDHVWTVLISETRFVVDNSALSFLKLFIFDYSFCALLYHNRVTHKYLSETDLNELLWYYLEQITFDRGYGTAEIENYKCLLNYTRPSRLTKTVTNPYAYAHLIEDVEAQIPYEMQNWIMRNTVFSERAARTAFLHPRSITHQMNFIGDVPAEFGVIKKLEYPERVQALNLYDQIQELKSQHKILVKRLIGLGKQRSELNNFNHIIADYETEIEPELIANDQKPYDYRSLPSVVLNLAEMENNKDIILLQREAYDVRQELYALEAEFKKLAI